jgi:hypothetical protein
VAGDKALCDGRVYHSACYERLLADTEQLRAEAAQLKSEAATHFESIVRTRSLAYRIKVVFGGQRLNVSELEARMSKAREMGTSVAILLRQRLEFLRSLWDFWPDYPPDWSERQKAARDAVGGCEECSADRHLHVHHRRRIGRGGNHRPENLVVLCSRCHGRMHGKDFTDREFRHSSRPGAYGLRIELLRSAIADGRPVRFDYRKFTGATSTRTLTPERFKQVGQSLCVEGWCHLRNDRRSFAVQRMRGVRLAADLDARRCQQ